MIKVQELKVLRPSKKNFSQSLVTCIDAQWPFCRRDTGGMGLASLRSFWQPLYCWLCLLVWTERSPLEATHPWLQRRRRLPAKVRSLPQLRMFAANRLPVAGVGIVGPLQRPQLRSLELASVGSPVGAASPDHAATSPDDAASIETLDANVFAEIALAPALSAALVPEAGRLLLFLASSGRLTGLCVIT